jgi:hypothetical protein
VSLECIQAQKDIQEIEQGFSNTNSIFSKTILNKGELLRLLAASYEVLSINKVINISVDHIASHIMKRITELNSELSSTRVYDSLPSKYKYHVVNPVTEEDKYNSQDGNGNSDIYTNYERDNTPEINYYNTQIQLCKNIILHLKTEPYILKTDPNGSPVFDLQEYESDMVIRNAAQSFVSDTFDNRKTVPLNTIHFLLQAFFNYNNDYAAGVYISKIKEYGIQKKDKSIVMLKKLFTSKQLVKILRGQTKEVHQSFEILTEDDAYENGFYGKAKCGECGNRRVRLEEKYDWKTGSFGERKLYCYACLKITTPPKVKLPLSKGV